MFPLVLSRRSVLSKLFPARILRRIPRPRPVQIVFVGFLATTAVGSLLLMLPVATEGQDSATPVEAIFTAVSALSVTGHIVVDTPDFWAPVGEVVILLLIQIGGLGVMTFASVVGLIVVRRLTLRSRLQAAAELGAQGLDVRSLVTSVVVISLSVEAIIALVLTTRFVIDGRAFPEALWLGIFHGVSSFNNAGFSLFSDNMVSYAVDPVVSLTICLAVIVGGLGFPVIIELWKRLPVRRWSMNTRIVLWATPILLVLGTVYVAVLEWNNPQTLGGYAPAERILIAFFQSVQTRTAGFNSVDIGSLHQTTLFGMDAMMLVGGGPAGTAGGIKVTTFAVLFFILIAELRGDAAVNVLGKRLSRAVHRQAIAVVALSLAIVAVATGAIMLLSGLDQGRVLFEVISAFSTVGLSTGITPTLPESAQLILAALMFVGRLGPIAFATALALRERPVLYQLPKERPIIG